MEYLDRLLGTKSDFGEASYSSSAGTGRRAELVFFVAIFSVLGLTAIILTTAATFVLGQEAETGSIEGNAALVADGATSGGSSVKFGESGTPGQGTMASTVSQYGITWTFDKQYPVGQFANGDWWVAGPVTISGISPAYAGGRNGWQVNPNGGDQQGLDNRINGFTTGLVPTLPYNATAGKSILKAVSRSTDCGGNNPCLTTAAVLTVLGSVPANNGANTFRPPFAGPYKQLFTTTQLKTAILPSLAPVSNTPSLASVTRRYQRPQIDYLSGWVARYMHASQNYAYQDNPSDDSVSEYGSEVENDIDEAALRLMLNDPIAVKMPALINYIQSGIDAYGEHKSGTQWYPDGGHTGGRKLPAIFAAVLLDSADMKAEISNAPYGSYGDDGHVYMSTNQKTITAMHAAGYQPALFGQACGAGAYELQQSADQGPRDCRDPLGMIDGGSEPGGEYQFCCTSKPMKGVSLAARLLPGGKAVWNYQPLHDYVDRWVGYGAWASPDDWNTLGKSPARNYVSKQGAAKDGGYYSSAFVDSMWTAYRSRAE